MNPPVALIVEADAEASGLLEIVLGEIGLVPFVVASGRKALSLMATRLPDLLVLDLHLPDISGADVLSSIRANPRSAEMPVIVTTAHPQMAEAVREEASLVLVKPIQYDELKARVTELVQSHASGD